MIRLILALTALLSLHEALALDMVAVNRCMINSTGYICPDSKGKRTFPNNEISRIMTRDQAKVYCECAIANQWDPQQVDMCLALSRACDYGKL